MPPRLIRWCWILAFAVALRAEDQPQADAAPQMNGGSGAGRPDYVLQPADLLRVQVFQEDDLTREVRISQEHTINLPLIGALETKGKNVRQLQRLIQELYDRDYLVNPQVNVFVVEYAKRSVNVLGCVNEPGVVLFPQEQGLTLLDAISRAGGFNRLADRRKIKLTRAAGEKSSTHIINADDIIQGVSREGWDLVQDDVIFVPERIL
jgi:polysaccharide export outer membrane protein